MKILQSVAFLLGLLAAAEGLTCWVCENQPSNEACLQNGKPQVCRLNENACQNEVRRGNFGGEPGLLLTKRCKESHACDNNYIQNPQAAWFPTQCNNERTTMSVCRCCCGRDGCNQHTLECFSTPPTVPPTVRQPSTPPPIPTCADVRTPINGIRQCFPGEPLPNGRFVLETQCLFACNEGFELVGSFETLCGFFGIGNDARFDNPAPRCRRISTPPPPPPIECDIQRNIRNGDTSCTNANRLGSTCFFECNDGYSIHPPLNTEATCQRNTSWTSTTPCCLRNCPPDALMDLVIILDSSTSIGEDNWQIMKEFVQNLIGNFNIGPNAGRVGVFRFNRFVDTQTQILLKDYPNDREGLMAAVDSIPYVGEGTRTGNAIRYARNIAFQSVNGDRPEARNVVLVVTDGLAQDGSVVFRQSRYLRLDGVLTYAVGVVPPIPGQLDREQLLDIAGSSQNVLIAERGFIDLDVAFTRRLGRRICTFRSCEEVDRLESILLQNQ